MGDEKPINLEKKSILLEPSLCDTLVLSGGGFRGLILLGSLQFLYNKNLHINISNLIGTSSGAMICYLLAIGYTPVEILSWLCTRLKMDSIHVNIVDMVNGHGATSYMIIQENLEKMTIEKIGFLPTLGDIKTKYKKVLAFPTYNYTKKQLEILSPKTTPELPALVAIRMSANLPLVFDHFKYNNNYYIDGGVINNFAVDVGEEYGSKVLGIIQSNDEKDQNDPPKNILEYVYQILRIPVTDSIERKIEHCTKNPTIIRVQHESSNLKIPLTTSEKIEMFDCGYNKTKEFFDK